MSGSFFRTYKMEDKILVKKNYKSMMKIILNEKNRKK